MIYVVRTTVAIDADVEQLLKDESLRSGRTLKAVLNDAIRASLGSKSEGPTLLDPVTMGLRGDIDPRGLNTLADDLEVEAFFESDRKLSQATK